MQKTNEWRRFRDPIFWGRASRRIQYWKVLHVLTCLFLPQLRFMQNGWRIPLIIPQIKPVNIVNQMQWHLQSILISHEWISLTVGLLFVVEFCWNKYRVNRSEHLFSGAPNKLRNSWHAVNGSQAKELIPMNYVYVLRIDAG